MTSSADPALIRPARVDDVEPLAEFIEPFVQQGKLLPRTRLELQDLISCGFVAELDGKIVGFAALEIYSPKLGEIRSLAVAEDHQGKGIGKRLVEACIGCARQRKILEVMVITSSEHFFKACGFDFTLPGEKKALFLQTRESYATGD